MQHRSSPQPSPQPLSRSRISTQAFLQQLSNWALTLGRQQKQLRMLKNRIPFRNKIMLNQAELIGNQIQGLLVRFRKIQRGITNGGNGGSGNARGYAQDVILLYNQNSKKFMDVMENIGNFGEKFQQLENQMTANNQNEDNNAPQNRYRYHQADNTEQQQQKNPSQKQKYRDETFTYSVSKQQKYLPSRSKNNSKQFLNKKSFTKVPQQQSKPKNQSKTINVTSTHTQLQISVPKKNSKLSAFAGKNNGKNLLSQLSYLSHPISQSLQTSQLALQLHQIKSLLHQIQSQLKYHSHQDIQLQLSKLQHSNKKISLEIKSLRQDNGYLMTRVQKIKEEIQVERQVQGEMIREFEGRGEERGKKEGRQRGYSGYEQANSRKRGETQHNSLVQDGVSDWVKVRI